MVLGTQPESGPQVVVQERIDPRPLELATIFAVVVEQHHIDRPDRLLIQVGIQPAHSGEGLCVLAQLVVVITAIRAEVAAKNGQMVKAETEGGSPDGRIDVAVQTEVEVRVGGLESEQVGWRRVWVIAGKENSNVGKDFCGYEVKKGHGGCFSKHCVYIDSGCDRRPDPRPS